MTELKDQIKTHRKFRIREKLSKLNTNKLISSLRKLPSKINIYAHYKVSVIAQS